MTESLGISVGSANLVASAASGPPTVRRSVVTLFRHRPPEVGVPSENPRLDERGLVLGDFVARVGDPVPIVASDGSTHRGDRVLAEALKALARSVSVAAPATTTIAVPAYWPSHIVDALRPLVDGTVVSDAVAALTALQAHPGLPAARGIVLLCDLGAAGTSITLADAGKGFSTVCPTLRYEDFSGDLIDQAVLRHVLTDLEMDPYGTSAMTALGQLRDQCQRAKERLSAETATGLTGPLPGAKTTVRLTRPELEALLQEPLEGLLAAADDMLMHQGIAHTDLVAAAVVGGGARMPYVIQRLSEALRIPVTTTHEPQIVSARGAALMGTCRRDDHTRTAMALPAASAAAPVGEADVTLAASAEPAPQLAWSEAAPEVDMTPYADTDVLGEARPAVQFQHDDSSYDAPGRLKWYRRPGVLFGAAAAAFLAACGGLALTSQLTGLDLIPIGTSGTPSTSAVVPPAEAPASKAEAPVPPAPAPVSPVAELPAPAPRQVPAPARNQVSSPPVWRQAPASAAPAPAPAAPAPVPAAPAPAPEAPVPEHGDIAPVAEEPPSAPQEPTSLIPEFLEPFLPGAQQPEGATTGGGAATGGAATPETGGGAPATGGTDAGAATGDGGVLPPGAVCVTAPCE